MMTGSGECEPARQRSGRIAAVAGATRRRSRSRRGRGRYGNPCLPRKSPCPLP